VEKHNRHPKPFIWTAKASDILAKVTRARFSRRSRFAPCQVLQPFGPALPAGHDLERLAGLAARVQGRRIACATVDRLIPVARRLSPA
jgi:hypothetical protein